MKLLILTQKIDLNDDLLGFMHGWIEELAKYCEKITVIALGVGQYCLPHNVKVLSLGKDGLKIKNPKLGISSNFLRRLKYIFNFYRYVWKFGHDYDCVFVHMNQEYVILGGIFWWFFKKRVALWRNHPFGGFWVRIAVIFSSIIFCTSKFAFVTRYRKTKIMPVGVDTNFFKPNPEINKTPRSILFFSRISPIKRPDLLIDALNLLKKENIDFSAKIVGDAPVRDKEYLEDIKQKVKNYGLEGYIEFKKGVPNRQAPEIYNQNEIFINLTPAGSLDKTIFEALACGNLVLMSNQSLVDELDSKFFFNGESAVDLAAKIKDNLSLDELSKQQIIVSSRNFVAQNHSLQVLVERLMKFL